MSFRPRNQPRPTQQAKRYRAGHVPENYVDELSESEEEEEEQLQLQQQQQQQERSEKHHGQLQFAQKEVVTGLKQIEISEQDAASDRRLRRLRQAQQAEAVEKDDAGRRRRRRFTDEQEPAQEEEGEDEEEQRRLRIKQKALEQQQLQEAIERQAEQEEEEESEEESGEEEVIYSLLDEFYMLIDLCVYRVQASMKRIVVKRMVYKVYPSQCLYQSKLINAIRVVGIHFYDDRAHRETIMAEEERQRKEEEMEKQYEEELEARKKQSHAMLADELKREKEEAMEKELAEQDNTVDDTDYNDQAEFDAWKVRELKRIKRDREERIA